MHSESIGMSMLRNAMEIHVLEFLSSLLLDGDVYFFVSLTALVQNFMFLRRGAIYGSFRDINDRKNIRKVNKSYFNVIFKTECYDR